MARLRRDLSRLEDEKANALTLAGHAFSPGVEFWHKEAARFDRAATDLRARVLEAMR